MISGETGKVGIIRRARESGTAARIRYSDVRDAIQAYLCNDARTPRTLAAIRQRFQQISEDEALGTWARDDARQSLNVLDALARMEGNEIAGARFSPAPKRQAKLTLSGVEVSVQLNVLMTRERRGREEIGGVLFRLSKADDETESAAQKRHDMGLYAATLALMQVERNIAIDLPAHHQLCASFDIQAEDIHWAPRTYAARGRALEDACRFIAAMWNIA